MVHDFVLKDGDLNIFKWNIEDYLTELRCYLSLLASFFFQQLDVEFFLAVKLWVAILQVV